MAKKLNSMRALETDGIEYDVMAFPSTIHSAQGVADYFGLPAAQVYKTLVILTSTKVPMLIIIPADQELRIKRLGPLLGDKKIRMATHQEAEKLTGLQVGGISALALRERLYSVYLSHTAKTQECVLVSAGQRGLNLRLTVKDLIHAIKAVVIDVPMIPIPN